MRTIVKILLVEDKGEYFITHALLDNQNEVRGWSKTKDFYKVGDKVESFFHEEWDQAKMRKKVGQ